MSGGFVCGPFSVLEVPAGMLTAHKAEILGYSVLLFLREEISMKCTGLRDSRTPDEGSEVYSSSEKQGPRTIHIMYFKLF